MVVGAWIFSRYYVPVISNVEASPLTDAFIAESANKDTDGDGLRDWEESLWETDPALSDTDGDGVSDAEEVRVRAEDARTRLAAGEEVALSQTLTGRFSRDFFATYLDFRADGELTEEEARLTLASALDRLELPPLPWVPFSDIKQGTDDSPVAIETYLRRIGGLSQEATRRAPENELEAFEPFVTKQDEAARAVIEKAVAVYGWLHKETLVLNVPPSLVPTHRKLTEAYARAEVIGKGLLRIHEDPVSGLLYIAEAERVAGALGESYAELAEAAKTAGIDLYQIPSLTWLIRYGTPQE